MVRSGKNPLTQIINRIEEIQSLFPVEDIIKTKSVGLKHPNNINEYKEFICIVMETNDNINVVCKVYSNVHPLYDLDNFTSDNIGCFVFDINDYYIELIHCAYLVNNIIFNPDCEGYKMKLFELVWNPFYTYKFILF